MTNDFVKVVDYLKEHFGYNPMIDFYSDGNYCFVIAGHKHFVYDFWIPIE